MNRAIITKLQDFTVAQQALDQYTSEFNALAALIQSQLSDHMSQDLYAHGMRILDIPYLAGKLPVGTVNVFIPAPLVGTPPAPYPFVGGYYVPGSLQ